MTLIFAFGEHELDEERFELRRRGEGLALQPKVLHLLLFLVRHRDRVVTKQEILEAVWADAKVAEGSLARAVSIARAALGDRGEARAVIATIPRRGYRFQAPVREITVREAVAPGPGVEDPRARYIGRRELLDRLEAAVSEALAGHGRILLLTGEAGIGKSRTAEILAERARRAGALVAAAWGVERDDPIHWTWTRVLRLVANTLPEAVDALTSAQRRDLARLVPELDPDPGADAANPDDPDRFRIFDAVQAFLTQAASRRPIALFLDDLHAMEAESLWFLESLGHAIVALPIAIVATCREDDAIRAPSRARAFERILRLTCAERWNLIGLSGDEVLDFVRARIGTDSDPQLAAALAQKTGGNPLLLGESLRSLETRGLLGEDRERGAWETLLPDGVQQSLRPKLRRLGPGARDVLACAAGIGVELERALLERCIEEEEELDARLSELEEESLLRTAATPRGRLRFSHALVREAVYAELVGPGEARRALHARIFSALDKHGPVSEELLAERAHHACEAAPLVDPRRAAALAHAAGAQAALLHEFERAAVWFERAALAHDLGSPLPAARIETCLALGAAQTQAGGRESARAIHRDAAQRARAIGRGDLLARAALGLAHRPTSNGHADPEVVDLLVEAIREVPPRAEPERIRLLSRLAAELRYDDPARATALSDEAIAAARQLGDPAVLGHALNDRTYVDWSPADTAAWIELNGEVVRAARAANDADLLLGGLKGRATGSLELGDIVAVDREIRACERAARTQPTPLWHWLCAVLRAMRALLEGDLATADREVAGSLRFGERVDSDEVALELYLQLFHVRLEQGRSGEILPALREQTRRFPDAPAWRAGLARVLLASSHEDEAAQELSRLAKRHFLDVPRDRGWLPTLAFAAEVAYGVSNASAAAPLAALLEPYASLAVVVGSGLVYSGPVSHHLGLVAAAQSHWDCALDWFDAALAAEAACGARIWEARTRTACANALLHRAAEGDRTRAETLLTGVQATARALALTGLAAETAHLEAAFHKARKDRGDRPQTR